MSRLTVRFCFYCAVRLEQGGLYDNRRTVDHLTPRARGGGDESTNLVDACAKCNRDKMCLTLEEYRAVMAVRRGLLRACSSVAQVVFDGERKPSLKMGQKAVKPTPVAADAVPEPPRPAPVKRKHTPPSEQTVELMRSQRDAAIRELSQHRNLKRVNGRFGALLDKFGLVLMQKQPPIVGGKHSPRLAKMDSESTHA